MSEEMKKPTPLQNPYDGPFKVLDKGPKAFKLQLGNHTDTISIDRLKVAITDGEVQAAVPPKRGRPPKNPIPPAPQQATPTKHEPTYAEIVSRSGRTIKPPTRLAY